MVAARKSGKGNSEKTVKKMKGKEYERELAKLHVELVKLQEWVKYKGLKVCVVFEERATKCSWRPTRTRRCGLSRSPMTRSVPD